MGRYGLLPPSGQASLRCNASAPYASFKSRFPHIGIFVGTPGPNRKIIVYGGGPEESFFIKIPTSPESARLVQNEASALAELSADPRTAPMIPHATQIGGHLAVQDQASLGAGFRPIAAAQVQAVSELLFARSAEYKTTREWLGEWSGSEDRTDTRPARRSLVEELALRQNREAVAALMDRLPEGDSSYFYRAHGDFTQWNVLATADGAARIIDWELYGWRPKHFDLIHYYASHDILVAMKPVKDVLTRLVTLRDAAARRSAIGEAEWNKYLKMYFAAQSIFYHRVFTRQEVLHPQALWQLNCWTYCLNALR